MRSRPDFLWFHPFVAEHWHRIVTFINRLNAIVRPFAVSGGAPPRKALFNQAVAKDYGSRGS